jgi:hypothetical protein
MIEDLLARTLHDPARALPLPADPVGAVRARARAQRRTAALAAAAVLAVVAVAAVVPGLRRDPAPVAAVPPGPGMLDWTARGALAGDAELVRAAADRWAAGSLPRPAGTPVVLWAGMLGPARVVVLQAYGPDGRALVAEVGDQDGALTLLEVEPVRDPGVPLLRLADPAGRSGTALLARPGGTDVVALAEAPLPRPVAADGLATDPRDLSGLAVAVLDRDGRVLGDGTVPTGRLLAERGPVRLASPLALDGMLRFPRPEDLTAGARLAAELPGSGPVTVAVVEPDGITLGRDHVAVPRFYELVRGGRWWTATELLVDGRSRCLRIVPGSVPDAVVLRCAVPELDTGVVAVALHRGIRLAGIDLGGWVRTLPEPAPAGWVAETGPDFPTGAGTLRLVDDGRQVRPPLPVPAYRP